MRNMLVISFCVLAHVAAAQDHEKTLEMYLTDDVVAVAYLDVSQIDTLGALEWAEKLGFGPTPAERGQRVNFLLKIQQQLDRFNAAGARYVYVLFRVADIADGGSTWVIPVAETGDPRAVLGMLLSGRPDQFHLELDARPSFFPTHCEVASRTVLGAMSATQLEQLKSRRPKLKRDLSDAWEAIGAGHIGFFVFGDQDSRRVVREMFPKLPEPFQQIDGSLIADRLLWGGMVADLPPEPSLRVIVQADQQSSAIEVQQSVADGLALLQNMPLAKQILGVEGLEALVALLKPQVVESRLVISCQDLLNDLDLIARLVTPPLQQARQNAQRRTRMSKFKQIALGMINYESARGSYPPRSTFDKDGRPLLSWRVLILPYMGKKELALWKQFHLDEPWDSEHNKQLIPLMPEVYADPGSNPKLRERNAVGRTTYVVPTGPGTAFEGSEGRLVKEITDGTSATIMLVELGPLAGPIWTRPKDWSVDFSRPLGGLRREDRDWFTTAFCDGSVYTISFSTPADKLRAWLGIADGEVAGHP